MQYDKPNKSKFTQAFYLLLGFAENQTVFWDFKIQNSVWITEGSDNGDSDNQGPTVYIYIYIYRNMWTIAMPYRDYYVVMTEVVHLQL